METSSNNFEVTVRQLRGGAALAELSAELAALVAAVRATGREGKLTFDLRIKPASEGQGETVVIIDEVKAKQPKSKTPTTMFYTDESGNLLRNDPRQREFELHPMPLDVVAIKPAQRNDEVAS